MFRNVQAACVILVTCAVLAGCTTTESQNQTSESQTGLIAQQEFDNVDIGERESDILARLGEPDNTQTSETGFGKSSCVYYTDRDDTTTRFQVCFTDHRVRSKNAY